jgi:hypothetical protein
MTKGGPYVNDAFSRSQPTTYSPAAPSPLDIVRDCFALLVAGPQPLALDGHTLAGLPDRPIPLDELRDRLMARTCPQATRDAAWTQVIRRSRAEGAGWTVGCAGMALPALAGVARQLAAHTSGDHRDVHAEVLAGFVAVLPTVDLDRPRIAVRLRWAAYRAGLAALTQALAAPAPDADLFAARSGPGPVSGHPDLVLADAVAEGVLTATEADLIAATRLDAVPVSTWAARTDTPARAAYTMRTRAERRLVAYLTGTPSPVSRTSPPPSASHPVIDPPAVEVFPCA